MSAKEWSIGTGSLIVHLVSTETNVFISIAVLLHLLACPRDYVTSARLDSDILYPVWFFLNFLGFLTKKRKYPPFDKVQWTVGNMDWLWTFYESVIGAAQWTMSMLEYFNRFNFNYIYFPYLLQQYHHQCNKPIGRFPATAENYIVSLMEIAYMNIIDLKAMCFWSPWIYIERAVGSK